MEVISWNVFCYNKNMEELVNKIRHYDSDVFCLQEFPEEKLHLLENLGYEVHVAKEFFEYRFRKKKFETMCLVILSKFAVDKHEIVNLSDLTEHNARGNKLVYGDKYETAFHFIEFFRDGKKVRVFNVHLKFLANPSYRMQQLSELLDKRAHYKSDIICGDFNSFSRPCFNFLIFWFFSMKPKDMLLNEVKMIREICDYNLLQMPITRRKTHGFLPLQLDNILLSEKFEVEESRVIKELKGSDHYPLYVRIK